MIKAPKGKVLIEDYQTSEYVRESGLVLPQNIFADSGRVMLIRSVGDGCDPELKPGMRVLCRHHQGIRVLHDGEDLRMVTDSNTKDAPDILLLLD